MICDCARENSQPYLIGGGGGLEWGKRGVGVIIGSIPHIPNVNTYVLPTKH